MYTDAKKSSRTLFRLCLLALDTLCLHLSFLLAYRLRIGTNSPFTSPLYLDTLVFILLTNAVAVLLFSLYRNIHTRGWLREELAVLKQTGLVFFLCVSFLYATKQGGFYSRVLLFLTFGLFFVLASCCHILCKKVYRHILARAKKSALLVVTRSENVAEILQKAAQNPCSPYQIAGFVLTDDGAAPVEPVCRAEQLGEYICHHWVDDVFLCGCMQELSPRTLEELSATGTVIHVGFPMSAELSGRKQLAESFEGYSAITFCINQATPAQAICKRLFDIFVSLFGCLATGLLLVVLAPLIQLQSPGPILFRQKRVGKNGKVFSMYKIRSMRMNADAEKANLLRENKIQDGMMFKMDFDPRIIGNRVLENGEKKTGIGQFIRKTSLDEFPQFFNVLKGDMSLVGTRPPTLDEWEKYELHHRARLSVKPGITGMWQVNGRSDITDFETVVALDTRYIREWSPGLDLRILCKTFALLFRGDGAM